MHSFLLLMLTTHFLLLLLLPPLLQMEVCHYDSALGTYTLTTVSISGWAVSEAYPNAFT
jgi:hypothetical protein